MNILGKPVEQPSESGDQPPPLTAGQVEELHDATDTIVTYMLFARTRVQQVALAQDLQYIALVLLQEETYDAGVLAAITDDVSLEYFDLEDHPPENP